MRNHIIWKYGKQLEKLKFEWAMLSLDTEDKDSRRNRSKMARMKFIPFDIESKNVLLRMPLTRASSIHLVTMDFNPWALSKKKIEFQRNGTYRLVEKG